MVALKKEVTVMLQNGTIMLPKKHYYAGKMHYYAGIMLDAEHIVLCSKLCS